MPQKTGVPGARPVAAAISGSDGAEAVGGGADRRHQRAPAFGLDERGEAAGGRVPEVGVAAERGRLGGGDAGEAEGPVLRVGQDRGGARGLRGSGGLPEELGAEVEARRQARRAGLGEGRAGGVVGGGELVGAGVLVVEDRQDEGAFGVEERGGGGVGGGDDRLDAVAGVEGADAVEDEAPDAFGVGVRIGRAGQRAVRAGDVSISRIVAVSTSASLALVLPMSMTSDAGGRGHSRWKTVSSGTATGELSGFVSMMSAMWPTSGA